MEREEDEVSLLKIAVVDSSSYYRNMISKTLEGGNFDIVGNVETSENMGEILNSNLANFFLIDILVPDVGGMELARFVLDKKQDAFIVIMSSLEGDDFFVEAIKIGIVDYLKKPFDSTELLKTIGRAEERMGGE